MSRSSDPDHFFQTTDSIETTRRKALKSRNENGKPIRVGSKILALIPDSTSTSHVYIAEATGVAKKVGLETRDIRATFKGPAAPLTSLTLAHDGQTLYAACWDKTIWSWSTTTGAPRLRFRGHTDFVKCILYHRLSKDLDILISGSADTNVIIWNARTGDKLWTIKAHGRGVQALAIDPWGDVKDEDDNPAAGINNQESESAIFLFSADSLGIIHRWPIPLTLPFPAKPPPPLDPPLNPHATSITSMTFDPVSTSLWATSLDKTAVCLSRCSPSSSPNRAHASSWSPQPDTTLPHPDYVRALALSPEGRFVITGGRDESIRVWDKGTGDLWGKWDGHFDEIMSILVIKATSAVPKCVSAGIDGTIRVWELSGKEMERINVAGDGEEREGEGGDGDDEKEVENEAEVGKVGWTEEEERELAELMEDDD